MATLTSTLYNFAFQKFSLKELEKCNDIEFLKGNGLSKTKIGSNEKYECILYGELYTLYNNLFIKEIYSRTDLKGKVLSKEGDVLIPSTTTADADGIAIARTLCKSNVIIGSDINIIRIHDKNRINPQYLSLVLSYPLKSELAKYARGANILHLNNTDIKKIKIPIPSLEEQENIIKLYQTKEQEIEDFKNKIKLLEMDMKNSIEGAFFQSKLHNSCMNLPDSVVADKGYDADERMRNKLKEEGIIAVIPSKKESRNPD